MKNRPVCQLNLYTLAKPNGNTIYVSKKIKRQIKNDQHRLSNIKLLLSHQQYDEKNPMIVRTLGYIISQPAITCSKLKIETLKQGVKYVRS